MHHLIDPSFFLTKKICAPTTSTQIKSIKWGYPNMGYIQIWGYIHIWGYISIYIYIYISIYIYIYIPINPY